jgi:DNA recombination protein RmuC
VRKAADTLDTAQTRTNQMRRALKVVEALPEAQADALLPPAETDGEGGPAVPLP